jgi:hypothetical protein
VCVRWCRRVYIRGVRENPSDWIGLGHWVRALDGIGLRRGHGGGRPREWPAIATSDFIPGGRRCQDLGLVNKTVCVPPLVSKQILLDDVR